MTTLLDQAAIQAKLSALKGWTLQDNKIQTTKTFDGFPSAVEFVNQLVEPAEAAGHHPDLEISYNRVTINLTSHDAGGITQKDFDLAQQVDGLSA
jgi:4a-hydroxytetrahydrobiopterin dehydratase